MVAARLRPTWQINVISWMLYNSWPFSSTSVQLWLLPEDWTNYNLGLVSLDYWWSRVVTLVYWENREACYVLSQILHRCRDKTTPKELPICSVLQLTITHSDLSLSYATCMKSKRMKTVTSVIENIVSSFPDEACRCIRTAIFRNSCLGAPSKIESWPPQLMGLYLMFLYRVVGVS